MYYPIKDIGSAAGWLDGASMIVFLIFSIWTYRFLIPRVIEETDGEHVTTGDFAIQVLNLPSYLGDKHANYGQLLREHFLMLLEHEEPDAIIEVRCECVVNRWSD